MPDWPLLGDTGRYSNAGIISASSRGTLVQSHASAHTKGSWVELTPSIPFAVSGLDIVITFTGSNVPSYTLFDLGIGAAASEQVILSNLAWYWAAQGDGMGYYLPISIPVGVRLAARFQDSAGSSRQLWVSTTLHAAQGMLPSQPFGKISSYGLNTATSQPTTIDPGGTVHTKGSWVEITSATSVDHSAFFGIVLTDFGALGAAASLLDIAIGAAGSEIIVVPDIAVRRQAYHPRQTPIYLPLSLPQGTRIAARSQCDVTNATLRVLKLGLYAFS